MKRRFLLLLIAVFLACALAAVTAFVVIGEEFDRVSVLPSTVVIEITPGQNPRRIAAALREAGLIRHERLFLWMASRSGADRTIRHGRHEFQGRVTLASILEELGRTPKPILRVTIPEGLTIRQTGQILEEVGATSADGYRRIACSEEVRRLVDAPPTAPCAEGYLFPDTYDLMPGMSPGSVVDLQIRRFRAVVEPLISREAGSPEADKLPVPKDATANERLAFLLTLASIVEKETGLASERERIAAVFYNRLRAGMMLQTDPTVIYGVIESGLPWNGNLTKAHLTAANPYNTYKRKGLPPGPICNPGLAAIEAVLNPAPVPDYYFVARGDGSHEFSASLDEHNRAVRRYQLR